MNSLRSYLIALIAALCLTAFVGTAQDASTSGQTKSTVSPTIIDCVAVLRDDYVEAVKPAPFLEGNKLTGKLIGFESDFAVFTLKGGKEAIYIPKVAILYITGKERHFTF